MKSKVVICLTAIVILASMAYLVVTMTILTVEAIRVSNELSNREVLVVSDCETMACNRYEDADESDRIAAAVIASIGTDREQECFGYNASYVLRVLTAEAGSDGELAWACATALFNECVASGNTLTAEEACKAYRWTSPADYISDEALTYFCKALVRGEFYDGLDGATLFYAPNVCGWSDYHESQQFVCTVNGVKFFKEV